jgi:catechol 2,3-dioxygenase-like lactoylglutathione lyase family enzyme
MAKLRHLALHTANPIGTADFYKHVFDMKEVHRNETPMAEAIIHLSDGYLHLALLRYRSPELAATYGSSSALGMSHIGFWLNEADAHEIRRGLTEAGAVRGEGPGVATPGIFFEEKWRGPDGVVFDLSDIKIGQAHYQARIDERERPPKIRHLALHTADAEATADFYKRVFDMEEVGRNPSQFWESIYLSDGTLNVTVLHFKSAEAAIRFAGSPSLGLSHFGFLVQSQRETARRLLEAGAEHMNITDNGQGALKHFEDKWKGPDGVVFDITDTGWTGARPLDEG